MPRDRQTDEAPRHPADVFNRARRHGAGGTGGVGGGPPAPPQIIQFPDEYAPPPDSTTFSATGFFDFPAVAGQQDAPAALRVVLPEGYRGIVRAFSQYVNNMVEADDVRWALRVNGNPVPNWNNVTMFPAVAAFRSVSNDPYIQLPEGAAFDVLITNVTGLAKKIGASFDGWWWPARGRGGQ